MKLFIRHKKLMKLLMFHVVIITFFFPIFGFGSLLWKNVCFVL